MSALLGLAAYSDDEEDEQSTTTKATVAATAAAAPMAGLIAYDDSDDDEQAQQSSSSQARNVTAKGGESAAAAAAAATAAVPAVAATPLVPLAAGGSGAHLAPLRPSSSSRSAHRNAAADDAALPAPAHARSASSSDLAAMAARPSADASAAAAAAEEEQQQEDEAAAVAALHERVLGLLPPGDPATLSAGVAQRHQENLSRAASIRARARSTGQAAPSLVQSLQANQAFHNPYILARIAKQMEIDPYGSNLPSNLWRDQNLADPAATGGWREEDDYLAIRKQAEDATAARLATRTSIDFVPPAAASAAAASAAAPSASSSYAGTSVATVNADGSITRVRVFDHSAPTAAAPAVNLAVAPPAATDAPRVRKSKWGQMPANPAAPVASAAVPAAFAAAALQHKRAAEEATLDASKKPRL